MARNSVSRRGVLSAMAGVLVPGAAAAQSHRPAKEYFEIAEVELTVPGLDPAHDGIRIAQLSDIHIGSGAPDGRVIAAVRALNEAQPDVAVLTGDYVTNKRDPYERVPQLLAGIQAPCFAVLGNHDHWTNAPLIAESLEGIGYAVLKNQHSKVRVRGVDFTVLGMDDTTTRHADALETFKGAPTRGSRLVLTHTPTGANLMPAWNDLVVLSGHTHGGQLHIPGVTENVFARVGQPYVRGLYKVRGNQLYVNRGLGFGKGTAMPRLRSDPELTLLTLRAAQPT